VWDKTRLHKLTRAQLVATLAGNVQESRPVVRSVALDPAEPQALITIYAPSSAQFYLGKWDWDADAASITWSPLGDTAMAAYPPNMPGKILTVGGRGATVRMANQVKHVSMSFRPQSVVNSVSFAPNSQLLACAGKDGTIRLWRLGAGDRWERDRASAFPNIGDPVYSVEFHPTRNEELLSVDDGGAAKIWQLAGAKWQATSIGGAVSKDNGRVQRAIYSLVDKATGAAEVLTVSDQSVKIWDESGKLRTELNHPAAVQCVAVSPDRKWVATGVGSEAFIWDGVSGKAKPNLTLSGHSANINEITFSEDDNGLRLFTAGADRLVKLWDTTTWSADDQNQAASRELLSLEEHSGSVVSVSFFHSKEFPALLTAGADGRAILWPTVNWTAAAGN
jgi:WD40 repeat protein